MDFAKDFNMMYTRNRHQFSLAIKKKIIALRTLDNWHGLVGCAYDYCVIAICVYLFTLSVWFYPIALIVIGSRQRALATILHESAHYCLARSPKLNHFLGTYLSGYLILQEFNIYTDSHIKKHHAFLGNQQHDPDLIYHHEQGLYTQQSKQNFFKRFILKPLLLLNSFSYLKYLITHRMNASKQYPKQFVAMCGLWVVIFAICGYYKVITQLILLWFIPLVTTAAVFGWFNELAEHYPMSSESRTDLYMSRNRFSHWLEHFLCNTHNEHYHLIHHLYATIPFWNLPKAHQILLEDAEYARINNQKGGIFVSNNHNPPLVKWLLQKFSTNTTQVTHE